MKVIVVTIINLFPDIYVVGEWLLSWTRMGKGDALQVVLYVEP
jgi:prepilin signal peptidase PulO-like enzyme (type II secretory pathway)